MGPNSRRFTTVVRILGFVRKFIMNLKRRSRKLPSDDQYKSEIKEILLTDENIEASQNNVLFKKQPLKLKSLSKHPSITGYPQERMMYYNTVEKFY